MGKIICDICRKKCKGDVLKVSNKYFHKDCFKCSKCQKSLESGGFFTKNSAYYCPDDYNKYFAIKCRMCETQIEGEIVSALGFSFHRHCFHCQDCHISFAPGDRVTLWSEKFYCKACVVARQMTLSEKENRPPAGSSTYRSTDSGVISPLSCDIGTDQSDSGTLISSSSHQPRPSRSRQRYPAVPPSSSLQSSKFYPGRSNAVNNGTLDTGSFTDAGYTSAGESGIEKTKSLPTNSSAAPISPCYSATSTLDENTQSRSIKSVSRSRTLEFGKHLNHSYLSLSEKCNQAKNHYRRSGTPLGAHPPQTQFFHRPNVEDFSYRNPKYVPPSLRRGVSLPTQKIIPNLAKPTKSKLGLIEGLQYQKDSSKPPPSSPSEDEANKDEAKRLSVFPAAHHPQGTPPIDRYDFPAPASTGVILAEKMREKLLKKRQQMQNGAMNGDSSELSSLSDSKENGLDCLDASGQKGKPLLPPINSGMACALKAEAKAERLQRSGILRDPISCSRSPNARNEPKSRPRYERHNFVSPSRDILCEPEIRHSIGYSLEYVSLGNRTSSTLPSSRSYSSRVDHAPNITYNFSVPAPVPRPGYTQGALTHSKTTSLPSSALNSSDWPETTQLSGDGALSGFTSVGSISGDGTRTPSLDAGTLTDPLESSGGAPHSYDHRGLRRTHRLTPSCLRARAASNVRSCPMTSEYLSEDDSSNALFPPGVVFCSMPSALYKKREKIPPLVIAYQELQNPSPTLAKRLDKSALESHLSDEEFQKVFNLPRQIFYRLPEWKRNDLKRRVHLF